jgi:hypothetical protein
MSKAVLCFFLMMIVVVAQAHAQVTTASVGGTVKDESGAVLPSVSISARNLETGSVRTVITDELGNYHVTGLAPGEYEISAELPGFRNEVRSGIRIAVGDSISANFILRVGQVTDRITVVGEYQTIETTNAALSGLVDDKQIRDLPLNARSFVQLSFLQPGVVEFRAERPGILTGRGPKMNVSGQRPSSNSFLLDGTYVNDAAGRTPGSTAGVFLGIDAVREFRVMTNSFTAEYGMAAGGVVNAITKSGTNALHGSAFWFHRNDNLDARNFFDSRKPEFRRHQFGYTVGGPIRQNKTFFFGAGEWFRQLKGVTQVARVPSPDALAGSVVPIAAAIRPYLPLFPAANGRNLGGGLSEHRFAQDEVTNETFLQGRIDHVLSAQDTLFGRYSFDDSTAVKSAATPNPLAAIDELSRNQYLTLEWAKVFSPKVLNTARGAFNRTNISATNRLLQDVSPGLSFVPGRPIGTMVIGGIGEWGPERRFPVRFLRNFYSFQNDLSVTRARHTLKLGGSIARFQDNNMNSFNGDGAYTFPSIREFLLAQPDRLETMSAGSAIDRGWRQWFSGFYVQDEYRPHPRMTFNLGLRYEFATVIKEAHGRVQNLRDVLRDAEMTLGDPMYRNPSLRNFAPRVGIVVDPFGKGTTVIRTGFGLFFDPYLSHYTFPGHILAPPYLQLGFVTAPLFPRQPLPGSFPNRIQNIQIVQYDAQNPYSMQYNLNIQHEVFQDLTLTVGYAGSRGVNLIRGGAVNIPIPEIVNGRKFFPAGAPRRNPNWSDIDLKRGDGNSWYNSLQVSAQKRFSQDYQFQLSYTYSKTIDEGSGFLFNDTATGVSDPQDPVNRSGERGLAAFNLKHNLVFNYTWELPFLKNRKDALGHVLAGWQVNGIASMRSGMPFTVGIRADRARALLRRAGQTRPDLIPGASMSAAVLGNKAFKQTGKFYDPSVFTLQPAGFLGTVGRNTMTGPNLANFDFSLVKNNAARFLGESGSVQLRFEFFNLFNRVNLSSPDPFVFAGTAAAPNPACLAQFECPLPTAGSITSTVTDSRQIQFALKLIF